MKDGSRKLKKTPLNKVHHEAGARMIDFGAWEMPVQYEGIINEHNAVRKFAGLFDASHMGQIKVAGPDALTNLEYLLTNNIARLEIGQILYTPMCKENGGIIDDLLVYCTGEEEYLLVVNAANTEKDYQWIREKVRGDTSVEDLSANYALLALQGPEAARILKKLSTLSLDKLAYYTFIRGEVAGVDLILSRTGYTGELGYELYCNPEQAEYLWKELLNAGKENKLVPAGLGARDTLRLEKGYCLYGNDIDENRHPLEAGLSWTVKFDKEFIGKESLLEYRENGYKQRLVGFKLIERGIARPTYKVAVDGQSIGEVSSGTYSPTLKENIGLAYLDQEYTETGQDIQIMIRNKQVSAKVVKTPFI